MLTPTTSLAELAGLPPGDVDAIARVGASAMASGRYALAVKIYEALVALEPLVHAHRLRLAFAQHGAGDTRRALDALDACLVEGTTLPPGAQVHALLLRAELVATGPGGREAARADLGRAHALAARSPEAKAALDGGGDGA